MRSRQRLVLQGEWAEFVADGGCRDPRWWLAAGRDWVQAQRIELPLQPDATVAYVSLYEADAYARWRSAQEDLG